ncbi:MAG: DUF4221 family protein [Cyclobacteriaceae bacterium]
MSKLGFFIILLLIAGCGSPEKGNLGQQRQLAFSLDTVLVDPGDEILYLRANLHEAELSADERFLYNYNPTDHALEKIDLDELKLVEKIRFEKEGPQGTGPFFTPFFLLGGDSILVAGSLKHVGIFNLKGEKLEEVKLQQTIDGLAKMEGGDRFRIKSIIPGKNNQFLGFRTDWRSGKFKHLMKVDMSNFQLSELDLPEFEKLEEYRVAKVEGGESTGFLGSQVFLEKGGGKIILSNSVFNELYVLHPNDNSLALKSFESKLTPNQKSPYNPKQVDNDEAMYRIYAKGLAEIEFERLIWDNWNDRYYRFSYQADMERVVADGWHYMSAKSSTIYLTVFDENLEMITESVVPELSNIPRTYFVKDGAIWIFENMEDELGFVRLNVDL